jgi:hypothetical protein
VRRLLCLYGIFISLFGLFFFIFNDLYHLGYVHPNILFYAEKVLLARWGEPPRLENIGFVYPPFAFLPFWFISDYTLASPLTSAVSLTIFLVFLLRRCSGLTCLFFFVVLILNPLVLFLSLYRFEILNFYILLALSAIAFIRYLETDRSFYIFLSGFLFGFCFFLDFRVVFLIPLVGLVVGVAPREKDVNRRLALLMVALSPALFFVLTWLYLNWIFTEDPLNFVKSPYSFFRSEPLDTSVLIASGSLWGTFKYTVARLLGYFPIAFPYFVVFFASGRYGFSYLMPLGLIYLVPVFLVMLSVYFFTFFPAYYFAIVFVLFSLAFYVYLNLNHHKLFIFSLVISLFFSWVMPLHSREENERNFVQFLIKRETINNVEEHQRVATLLEAAGCKKTLIDDASSFPVVVFLGDPKKFYLPYMYDYYAAISYPKAFANCIVVDKTNPRDKVFMRFPESSMGFLMDYFIIYEGTKYNVFKCYTCV